MQFAKSHLYPGQSPQRRDAYRILYFSSVNRVAAIGISAPIGCHTFRANGRHLHDLYRSASTVEAHCRNRPGSDGPRDRLAGRTAGTAPSPSRPPRALGKCGFRQEPRQFRVVEAAAADGLGDPVVDAALEQQERIGKEIIGAEKIAPHADRPGGRVTSSASACSISSNRSNGSRPSVEFVDKSDDRHVAQPADLEELAGLLLDAALAPLGRRRVAPSLTLPRKRPQAGEG